jgi:NADH dehydrogenase [ubiquinone] 1 alpha subcomplex assembly factor 6
MPQHARDSYFALRAFNVELASVKDGHNLRKQRGTAANVAGAADSSLLALQFRMQWWRNAIAQIYNDEEQSLPSSPGSSIGTPSWTQLQQNLSTSCWNSPVVRALDRANAQVGFTRRFLERIIDARDIDLEMTQYESMNQMIEYAEDTVGSLLFLTLETMNIRERDADMVAALAGKGIGLTTALRATPQRLWHGGELPIPKEVFSPDFPFALLLAQSNFDSQDHPHTMLNEEEKQMLRDAVYSVASVAMQNLIEARNLQRQVPFSGRSCLLPMIPSLKFLERLQKAEYNVFHDDVITTTPRERLYTLLLLARTWLTGTL